MTTATPLKRYEVFDDIQSFLNSTESDNTYTKYKFVTEKFFEWKYGVKLHFLTHEHIEGLEYEDMRGFQSYLKNEMDFAASTVNNYMASIRSLLTEMKRFGKNKYNLDMDLLKVDPLKVTNTKDTGYVSWTEVDEMIEYLKTKHAGQRKEDKAVLLHIGRLTGIRKGGLLGLERKDIVKQSEDVYVIHHTIKGKSHKTAIKREDAEMMLNLKGGDNGKVFKISPKSADRLIEELREEFRMEGRNFTFHSLRVLSACEVYNATGGDVRAVMNHLGHENEKTTMGYINKMQEIQDSPALYIGRDMGSVNFDGMDGDDFKEIFHKLSRSAQYEILNTMKKMG